MEPSRKLTIYSQGVSQRHGEGAGAVASGPALAEHGPKQSNKTQTKYHLPITNQTKENKLKRSKIKIPKQKQTRERDKREGREGQRRGGGRLVLTQEG